MHPRSNDPKPAGERVVRSVFAAMALLSVVGGLAIYLLQKRLGIPSDTARIVSSVFLLAGIADTLVLYFWARIFRRRT